MPDFRSEYLRDIGVQLGKLRTTAEQAIAQIGDDAFERPLDRESNSIAILVKHIAGNLRSRCTDFLTTDGEKPDRDRDAEFEHYPRDTREKLMGDWAASWDLLARMVESLTPEDLGRTVYIRKEPLTVVQALHRHLSHLAYHVGQIVLLAKHWSGGEWQTLTIARGQSKTFAPHSRSSSSR